MGVSSKKGTRYQRWEFEVSVPGITEEKTFEFDSARQGLCHDEGREMMMMMMVTTMIPLKIMMMMMMMKLVIIMPCLPKSMNHDEG